MNAMLQAGLHQVDMTAPILTRLLLVALFPLSALDKLVHWRTAVHQANARAPRLGRALVVFGIVVELIGFFCIVLDWHKQPAAVLLAVFCLVTAFVYHPFWTEHDYWTPDGGRARVEFWEFLKDLSVAGGLLLYATMVSSEPFSAMFKGMMR